MTKGPFQVMAPWKLINFDWWPSLHFSRDIFSNFRFSRWSQTRAMNLDTLRCIAHCKWNVLKMKTHETFWNSYSWVRRTSLRSTRHEPFPLLLPEGVQRCRTSINKTKPNNRIHVRHSYDILIWFSLFRRIFLSRFHRRSHFTAKSSKT